MSALIDTVRHEVEDLHVFFTNWFSGAADRAELEARLASRLHPDFIIVSPEGIVSTGRDLMAGFERAHGTNPDFRIQIRDVTVRFHEGGFVLATYQEWQTGAKNSALSKNARFSTALLKLGAQIQWLHLQETWLPESVSSGDPFDF